MSCFRPNHTKAIANWPGAETHNPLSTRHELYSPDEIEISALARFLEEPMCRAALGQLVCQYRQPNASLFSAPTPLSISPDLKLKSKGLQLSYSSTDASVSLDAIRSEFSLRCFCASRDVNAS